MLRAIGWLVVIGGAVAVGYFGFVGPRPLRRYSDRDLDQLEQAQTQQIAEVYGEAEKNHFSLNESGAIDGKVRLKDVARLQTALVEALTMRGEIQRERLARKWRFPAAGAVVAAVLIGIAIERFRRRAARPETQAKETAKPIAFSPADSRESWARTTLGVSAFATPEDVESAFRQEMARYHPDKVAGLGTDLQKLANERTRDLVEAREVLRRTLRKPGGGSGE
jgi:hypothetical protein